MNRTARQRHGTKLLWAVLLVAIAPGCRRGEPSTRVAVRPAVVMDLDRFGSEEIGNPMEGRPWITHVGAVDLDRDGRMDVLACDAQKNAVSWLRQDASGSFVETVLAGEIPGPVHTAAVDMNDDGDLDVLVACMGQVLPSNERIGRVVILENDGRQTFARHDVMTETYRVTDVQPGDFNGDGRIDLAVAKFGYDQGEVAWMENHGAGRFTSHPLLSLPGAVNVCVADMDGDYTPDIVALISQQYEEVHLLSNHGAGAFRDKVIFGSTNEDFGSSGISLCDVDRDGRMDVLFSNGDGFDYAEPGARPWHGVQWLQNAGAGNFRHHRIANLPGAYSPVGADLDGDADIDVICVSGFNNWSDPAAVSLIAWFNDGRQNFTPHVLAHAPTHLIAVAAADFDGTGRPALVTAGFHAYPPWDRMSRIRLWRAR